MQTNIFCRINQRLSIFLLILMMGGCIGLEKMDKTNDTAWSTPDPTIAQLTEQTPTKIFQVTKLAKSPSPTASNSHTEKETSTSPLSPTYSAYEAKENIINFLDNNGNCLFPCIWGIDPVVASSQEARDFVSGFGKVEISKDFFIEQRIYPNASRLTSVLWNGDLRTFINYVSFEEEGVIEKIVLDIELSRVVQENDNIIPVFGNLYFSELLKAYLLPNILTDYGLPTQILIRAFDDDLDRKDYNPLFSLVLIYDQYGFLVEYLFPKETDGNFFVGCPNKTAYISIATWDSEQNPTIESMVERKSGLGINNLNFHQFIALENGTLLTINDFLTIFEEAGNQECIKTPKSVWISP